MKLSSEVEAAWTQNGNARVIVAAALDSMQSGDRSACPFDDEDVFDAWVMLVDTGQVIRAALEAAPDPEEVALMRAVCEADRRLRDAVLTWLDDRTPPNMGVLTTALMDAAQASNELAAWRESL